MNLKIPHTRRFRGKPVTRHIPRTFSFLLMTGLLIRAPEVCANRLLRFDDSTNNIIAAGQITSTNQTGWNDPSVFVGDLVGSRYHAFVAIKDTARFLGFFDHCDFDSAKLSLVVFAESGTPGGLDFHFIKRDTVGMGVYPAYDDGWNAYCRSSWYRRKGANTAVCDSIFWDTPGATGPGDYNPTVFATIASPSTGTRYDVDVTPWIAGLINGADSVSNGILIQATNEDGTGTDYIAFRNILPFFNGSNHMILKVWVSNWDWVKVRLDSNRVDDGWISVYDPDTIVSDNGYMKTGSGPGDTLQASAGVVFPDDSTLFGADAIPAGYRVDSARVWFYINATFAAPHDSVAVGEIVPAAAYTIGRYPTWDSAADGTGWSGGQWSTNDVVRRDARLVDSTDHWYSWSVGAMIQRWLDFPSTRHGVALWQTGQTANVSAAWVDRTDIGFNAKAGSLVVWISPAPPRVPRRAWIDNPSYLK